MSTFSLDNHYFSGCNVIVVSILDCYFICNFIMNLDDYIVGIRSRMKEREKDL